MFWNRNILRRIDRIERKLRMLENPNPKKYQMEEHSFGYIRSYNVMKFNYGTWDYEYFAGQFSNAEAHKIVECLNEECNPTTKKPLTAKKKGGRDAK